MKWFVKTYRVILILSVIGSFLILGLDLFMVQYGETSVNRLFFNFLKFIIFAFILWAVDRLMVNIGLLEKEPEYLGFLKKIFGQKKNNGG